MKVPMILKIKPTRKRKRSLQRVDEMNDGANGRQMDTGTNQSSPEEYTDIDNGEGITGWPPKLSIPYDVRAVVPLMPLGAYYG